MSYFSSIKYQDSGSLDSFSRLRVSSTSEIFSVQSQYDAEPLQMEGGATGTGVAPAHSANTRMVALSATAGTKTAYFKCATVQSEGGNIDFTGYVLATPETTATAGSGSRVPLLAIRPKTTFNTLTNRPVFEVLGLSLLCTGVNPVFWELVIGGNYSGQTYADVSTTYSGFEYTSVPGAYTNLTGGLVLASGYIGGVGSGATAQPPTVTPITIPSLISRKYPITLSRAGAARALGTLTVLVSGIGGTSACRGSMSFKEIR